MNFSTYFKAISSNKSVRILANEYGVSHTTIYKILKGEMDNPTPLVAARLCIMLDLDPMELKKFDFNPSDDFILETQNIVNDYASSGSEPKVDDDRAYNNFHRTYIMKYDYPAYLGFRAYAYDEDFNPGPGCVAYGDDYGNVHLMSFIVSSDKIYKSKNPYHNIRDFLNYILMITTEYGRQLLDENINGFSDVHFSCKYCTDFIFFTTSKSIYDEIKLYKFDYFPELNFQLIYSRYNRKMETTVLSGKEIIQLNSRDLNENIHYPLGIKEIL
ncbi:MAG: hypothetical protein IJI66_07550 [Erysipelotrichaceae bacterium]|nr:hypothetical protein [Erysipelotrichaceae bacterium]